MSLRYEVWAVPWASTFERIIADLPVVDAKGLVRFNDFGEASVTLPADYGRVDEIISSTVGRMIRVYNGTTIIQEFLAERVDRDIDDETIEISGGDLATVFDKVIVYPHDYPDSPSKFPDWIYGGSNKLSNAGFEDPSAQPNEWELYNDATGGTFTLSDGTDTTSAIAYDASASTVETRLETDISAISDVLVTGNGNEDDPWIIEFVNPALGVSLTVDDTSLTGGSSTLTETQDGVLLPAPWTESQKVSVGTPKTFGLYDTFEVSSEQAHTGTYSLKIDPGAVPPRFAGAQQRVRVKPGGTYQASIWVYPTSGTDEYRFVLRKLSGEYITSNNNLGGTTFTANTWTQVTISDVTIPDGTDEIIFRFANVEASGDPSIFYIDDAALTEGQAASTVGTIVTELMDDASTDHSGDTRGTILGWVDYSGFDASNDSDSAAWNESLSITLNRGMTYGQVFDKLRDAGYEWRLTPKASPGPTTHDLEWYNEDNLGDDYENSDTPAVSVGQSTTSGPVVQRIPDYTSVLVEGAGNAYTEDKDTTAETNFGRLEKYFGDKRWTDATTRTAVGDQALAAEADNRIAVKVSITENPKHPIPLVDYKPGDVLNFQVPPVLSRTARRVQSITWNHGENATYDVTGSKVFPGESGGWETLRVLLRKFQTLDFEEGEQGVDVFGGGGGAPTLVVAASDASDASKSKADYVCTGVNDQDVIQAAADTVGRVLLTEGTFDVSDTTTLPANTALVGMGRLATTINITTTGITVVSLGNNCDIRDLAIVWAGSGQTATGIDASVSNVSIHNVWFQDLDVAVSVVANGFTMTGCYMQGVAIAIDGSSSGGIAFGVIASNVIVGGILLEDATDRLSIIGNTLVDAGMFLTNTEMITVAGNTWYGSHVSGANDLLVADGAGAVTIDGNLIYCIGYNAPEFTNCVAVTVTDNQIINCNMGLSFTTTDYIQVVGNVIGGDPNTFGFNSGSLGEHGISLNGCSNGLIATNDIIEPGEDADNTYDGIILSGDSDRNYIHGNKVVPPSVGNAPRYGINIAVSTAADNIVVGNSLGDPATYGTDALNDGGTNTRLMYPSDATYGDNFAFAATNTLAGTLGASIQASGSLA